MPDEEEKSWRLKPKEKKLKAEESVEEGNRKAVFLCCVHGVKSLAGGSEGEKKYHETASLSSSLWLLAMVLLHNAPLKKCSTYQICEEREEREKLKREGRREEEKSAKAARRNIAQRRRRLRRGNAAALMGVKENEVSKSGERKSSISEWKKKRKENEKAKTEMKWRRNKIIWRRRLIRQRETKWKMK